MTINGDINRPLFFLGERKNMRPKGPIEWFLATLHDL